MPPRGPPNAQMPPRESSPPLLRTASSLTSRWPRVLAALSERLQGLGRDQWSADALLHIAYKQLVHTPPARRALAAVQRMQQVAHQVGSGPVTSVGEVRRREGLDGDRASLEQVGKDYAGAAVALMAAAATADTADTTAHSIATLHAAGDVIRPGLDSGSPLSVSLRVPDDTGNSGHGGMQSPSESPPPGESHRPRMLRPLAQRSIHQSMGGSYPPGSPVSSFLSEGSPGSCFGEGSERSSLSPCTPRSVLRGSSGWSNCSEAHEDDGSRREEDDDMADD